ncbi:MAG: V-type ATPase subunit [Lachnospiraceae bacterium]|nr:V-type ATPase subunit [Candidatus Equihabitans merdae]
MGSFNDVYAVSQIRVKEKTLLSNADISQIVSLKDEKAIMDFLQEKGWGDPAVPQTVEEVLTAEETKAFETMTDLNIDEDVFEVLSYPKLFHNLKAAIKEVCTEGNHPGAFYQDIELNREAMTAIVREKAFDKLPDAMSEAAPRAYEAMLVNRDGQMCDVICDRACLDAMEHVAQTSPHEILRDYEESTVAVTDIRIAVRCAKTGKSLAFLKEALAPCTSLDVNRIAQAASDGMDSLLNYLNERGFEEAAEALKVSDSAFERWCDNHLIESIQPQSINPFTLGPVVAYYLARKNEIKTIRIILTAKANGVPEEVIRERIREMYV